MELLVDRDPEEARELLDAVLERMMEAVHRYEGTVNQVMGDGIMALFGAPLACEDHGVRACFAALRMQEEFGRYAEELRRTRGLPLHIRIGINSGEVVVRAISNDLSMDYTAVGQTTHLAGRWADGGARMPSSLRARCASLVKPLRSSARYAREGPRRPIEVYELIGATPFAPSPAAGPTERAAWLRAKRAGASRMRSTTRSADPGGLSASSARLAANPA
jgi:class 3 adenylate cyclase